MKIKIFGIILFVIIAFIVSSCNGNGSGNQFDQSGFFNDTSYKAYPFSNVVTKVFPIGFNAQEFVLAMTGSQGTDPSTVEGSVTEVES